MNNIIKYDFSQSDYQQSMNPVGLSFNFFNKSLFKEVDQDAPGTDGPLHEPKDKNLHYAYETAPYHSGGIPGKMESTITSNAPIEKDKVNTKDMYVYLQKKLQDMHRTLFDTNANVINNSNTREQKFESSGMNTSVPGNNNPQAYRIDIGEYDNPREYDISNEQESYIGFLKHYYDKMASKINKSNTGTIALKADDQKKDASAPEEVDMSPASFYRIS